MQLAKSAEALESSLGKRLVADSHIQNSARSMREMAIFRQFEIEC